MFGMDSRMRALLLGESIPSFQATCRQTENLGFGEIFYAIARAMRPQNVCVVGSKAGFAPACFAQALKDNGGSGIAAVEFQSTALKSHQLGHVDFVDPSYSIDRGDPNHSFGIGTWDVEEEVKARWARWGLHEFITHHKVTSQQYLAWLGDDHMIDLVYIDGDHSFEGIDHDIRQFAKRLTSNGIILAHDVDPRCSDSDGYRVFEQLEPQIYEKTRIPIYPGLALIRPR